MSSFADNSADANIHEPSNATAEPSSTVQHAGPLGNVYYSEEVLAPDELVAYGAKQIMSLFMPVTMCMIIVIIVSSAVPFYAHTEVYLIYTPFHTPDADMGTRTWQTIANTLIFMAVIVLLTGVFVMLFKYRCYKLIHGWLILITVMLLFITSFVFFTEVLRSMRIFVDNITMALLLWNFGVLGMIAIHWNAPLPLQQAYLIFMSAQLALLFLKYLPKWTCWVVLGALSIWDLIAVLCPRGPLRMLIEMSSERQQPLFPALLYSTTAMYLADLGTGAAAPCSSSDSSAVPGSAVASTTGDTGTSDQNQSNTLETSPLINYLQTSSSIEQHAPSCSPVNNNACFNTSHTVTVPDNTAVTSSIPKEQPKKRTSSVHAVVEPVLSTDTMTSNSSTHPPLPSGDAPPAPTNRPDTARQRWLDVQDDVVAREETGVKLGLGDFVFYSLLIGRAALDSDIITVVACYISILVGMCVTIIVLGIARRALPALPISIACGILFYFITATVISPFLQATSTVRIFF